MSNLVDDKWKAKSYLEASVIGFTSIVSMVKFFSLLSIVLEELLATILYSTVTPGVLPSGNTTVCTTSRVSSDLDTEVFSV